jgi:ribosomal protein L29
MNLETQLIQTQSEYINELKNQIQILETIVELKNETINIRDKHISDLNKMINEFKNALWTTR